jgi:hypothetical protein
VGAAGTKYLEDGSGIPENPTAADYIQEDLIAMYDGIENAGWDMHNDSATVWNDLIGTRNFSRYFGSVTFGDDHAVFNGSSNLSCPSGLFSATQIECVFEYDATSTKGCVFFTNQNLETQIYVDIATNQLQLNYWPTNTRYVIDVAPSTAMSVSVREKIGYLNGQRAERIQSGAPGRYYFYPINPLCGSGTWRGDFFKGKIYCIRCYSRALTDKEIRYNSIIDTVRFNLP